MHKTLVALALILSTSFAALTDQTITATQASSAASIVLSGTGTANTGKLVCRAGDFDGDGTGDYLVAADNKIYVVLGKASRTTALDLSGTQGTDFLLITVSLGTVTSIAAAGDINGDNNDDIAFGVSGSDTAFVVYGKNALTWSTWESAAAGLTITASSFTTDGQRGIQINGKASSGFGASVAAAGNFDNALKADLAVGATGYSSASTQNEGYVCIVFGKPLAATTTAVSTATTRGKTPVDCTDPFATPSTLQTAGNLNEGIAIRGAAGAQIGNALALLGDMNADGFKDLIIGAAGASSKGAAYIVYGLAATQTANIDISGVAPTTPATLPWTVITGPASSSGATDGFGFSVASAGDFNGDKISDAVVGYPSYDVTGTGARADTGRIYIIFGATPAAGAGKPLPAVDFSAATAPAATVAITYTGAAASDFFGYSVDSVGDVNDSGVSDIIVGAPLTTGTRTAGQGKAYVIYGKAGAATTDLSTSPLVAGTSGVTLTGPAGYGFGLSVAGLGDVNKDNIPDFAIGAPLASSAAGRVYEFRGAGDITGSGKSGSGYRLHASLLVLASFFVALMF